MTDGIALLFDQPLTNALLYDQEILQYKELEKNADSPLLFKRSCEVYGSSYLLRLITKLPSMLGEMPRQELCITGKLGDLIHFLHVNNKLLFSQSYRKPLICELTPEEQEAKKAFKY